ncbi:benzoate/H(+) symporter BenE family transporter [Nocardioides sp. TRM66260-LWL]|uniref:benzoate/H(+) symporter BenE family transporter n=1 Tax=Nocardioides sp. TRM66260-LWL TaxID=2874478 RepID=UPI001CC60FF0|nr:benzoate/H(+) symporter BenE family transporter [Nocardioides sp. TRM66260-LWL]MBZ5733279.1 benzoate/H(+) symporter BenE family transporter [Nocardioides sp. TRM66260-LWL]
MSAPGSPAIPAPGPSAAAGSPVAAGVVAALVGFASSFVVVLAGLRAVGATPSQATSGLTLLCLAQGLGMLWLTLRHRTPLTLAWSTPGAAVLAGSAGVAGGWSAAVAAFAATGVLIVLTGLLPRLGALVASIPVPLARAMLAGVLLPLCLEPVTALVASPAAVAPVVSVWLVGLRVARRWAVPAALATALVVVAVTAGGTLAASDLVPRIEVTAPHPTLGALIGVTLPLYVVAMASQNVPGVAIMAASGYRVPWRETMGVTGLATLAAAPFGGHTVNLAAITAALCAGPDAGPDPTRRWRAAATAAGCYLLLAAGCGALAALVTAAPAGVVQAAAGLALVGTLATSLTEALADPAEREAAAVTLLVAASGISVAGVGAAFWALAAGLAVRALLRSTGAGRLSARAR